MRIECKNQCRYTSLKKLALIATVIPKWVCLTICATIWTLNPTSLHLPKQLLPLFVVIVIGCMRFQWYQFHGRGVCRQWISEKSLPDWASTTRPDRRRCRKTSPCPCGLYNRSGEFGWQVGVPAKSGSAGGIMAAVPGRLGIGTFSPLLDDRGNSVCGMKALEYLSRELDLSIY